VDIYIHHSNVEHALSHSLSTAGYQIGILLM